MALALGNLLFQVLLYMVEFLNTKCYVLSTCIIFLTEAGKCPAASTGRPRITVLATSSSCAVLLVVAVGLFFGYRYHQVRRLEHELFFDVAGIISLFTAITSLRNKNHAYIRDVVLIMHLSFLLWKL